MAGLVPAIHAVPSRISWKHMRSVTAWMAVSTLRSHSTGATLDTFDLPRPAMTGS
jgi:hypothetical protein